MYRALAGPAETVDRFVRQDPTEGVRSEAAPPLSRLGVFKMGTLGTCPEPPDDLANEGLRAPVEELDGVLDMVAM